MHHLNGLRLSPMKLMHTNKVVTPYLGRDQTPREDSFNGYHSSCLVAFEQAFGILICRFGIIWSAFRYSLPNCTLVVLVACKLHNFIIDNAKVPSYEMIPHHVDNHVIGTPVVHFQDICHIQRSNQRSRVRRREKSA